MKETTLLLDRELFAQRLFYAIKSCGFTYKETARRARPHLPDGMSLSDVSVWSYAKGRSLPRRLEAVEALASALEVPVSHLMGDQATSVAVEPPVDLAVGGGPACLRLSLDVVLPQTAAVTLLRLLERGGEEKVTVTIAVQKAKTVDEPAESR